MYLNRLTLIGFIGGDAEETETIANGSAFTAFWGATQRSWKNSDGVWESRTEWHRCDDFQDHSVLETISRFRLILGLEGGYKNTLVIFA